MNVRSRARTDGSSTGPQIRSWQSPICSIAPPAASMPPMPGRDASPGERIATGRFRTFAASTARFGKAKTGMLSTTAATSAAWSCRAAATACRGV